MLCGDFALEAALKGTEVSPHHILHHLDSPLGPAVAWAFTHSTVLGHHLEDFLLRKGFPRSATLEKGSLNCCPNSRFLITFIDNLREPSALEEVRQAVNNVVVRTFNVTYRREYGTTVI